MVKRLQPVSGQLFVPGGRERAIASSVRTTTADRLIWWLIAAIAAVDALLLIRQHLGVSPKTQTILGVLLLYAVSRIYQRRSRELSEAARVALQVVVFSNVGALLTYAAMAATPRPMADAVLASWDSALGIPWRAWFALVKDHPGLHLVLVLAYASIPAQAIVLIGYSCYANRVRVREFTLACILAVILITPLMALLPAVGAWSQYHVGLTEPWRADILALRAHSLHTIGEPQGIISFPSFHAMLAVFLTYLARGLRIFWPVLLLNVVLVASTLTEGAHYGVDVIAGLGASLLVLVVTRRLMRSCESIDQEHLSEKSTRLR
jgi:membrane-associated phospholipid phosphatase